MNNKHDLKLREVEGKREVFDPLRKKWVAYTPEEHVRQTFILFLTLDKGVPPELIAVEQQFKGALGKEYRADIVVYGRNGTPRLLVECKAADVRITRDTVLQATRYNYIVKAGYIALTNGHQNFLFRTKDLTNYAAVNPFPVYSEWESANFEP
ncbi:MAG: type I restriction enzyme HsdR N-terminal domain-containing protein [Rikenellaceae bacterium]|nr:type I restriction enzyme HsdR N-terminal domain-containing protein [Rikenellaceae bacterium]